VPLPLGLKAVSTFIFFSTCVFCSRGYEHDARTYGGKSKKLALIAVCNKRLQQAFAIAKSGLTFDNNYRSTLVKS